MTIGGRERYRVLADPENLDLDAALALLRDTHWGGGLTRDTLQRAVVNSLTFALLEGETLVGLARAVTDRATYAYLTDVVIADGHRGRGIGTWFMECVLAHPDLQELRRVALLTRDATHLYQRLGFTRGPGSLIYLERRPAGPDVHIQRAGSHGARARHAAS